MVKPPEMPPKQVVLPAPHVEMMLTDFSAGVGEHDGNVLVVTRFQCGNFYAQIAWPHKNTAGIIDGLKTVALDAHRRDQAQIVVPGNGSPSLDELAKRRQDAERKLRGGQ